MKHKLLQLLGAFVLGAILPGLLMNGRCLSLRFPLDPTQSTVTDATQPSVQDRKLPVLLLDGTISWIELERYITGVVLAEVPPEFESEALRAQAVVARTYALKRQEEGVKHPLGAVCADPGCCQAYRDAEDYLAAGGLESDVEKVKNAVVSTAGQVLLYDDRLIEATYFSCSGGKTEKAAAVWGTDVPYLQSVLSPGEETSPKYEATVRFSKEQLSELLGISLLGQPEKWITMQIYTEGGGVGSVMIAGHTFTGVELRKRLGLNSTAFTVTVDGNGLTFTTYGHGHRVGMSQYGAEAMAVSGSSYQQILAYYYQGTRIDKIDAIG